MDNCKVCENPCPTEKKDFISEFTEGYMQLNSVNRKRLEDAVKLFMDALLMFQELPRLNTNGG
jgi:hypothetical protein